MKKIFYLIFLQIGICKIGISQCDIAHNGLGAFPSPIAVGQTSVFTFSISNQGTETSCEYGVTPVPPETNPDIRVTFSLPATGYVFDGFVYPAPTSATTASGPYFNWSYNPSTRVITGRNNRTIPWQEGEVDIKIRVKGTAPSFNSSNLNIQVLNGASNINTGNDAVSASLRVTGLSVTAAPTQIICGATTGSVSINLPTGGTSPFSISGPGITGSVSVPTANFPYIVTNVPAGTHTYTVTDVNSNSGTAQVIINPAPVVPNASVSPSSFVLDCNTPSKELIASGGGTYLWSANAGSATTSNITVTAAGTYTVTVTGSNGCTAQATATITKTLDTELPKIVNCPSTVNVSTGASSTNCFAIATWTEPTATDNCTLPANLVWTKSHNPGASFAVGTTVVTYTAKDEANNVSLACTFNVVVEDNTAPAIISGCPTPTETVTVNAATCKATITLPVFELKDNCTIPSSSITQFITIEDGTTDVLPETTTIPTTYDLPVGNFTITYVFKDEAGNEETCVYTVVVNKITPNFTQVSPICAGVSLAALPTTSNNGVVGTWAPAINNLATTTYTFTPTNPSCANSTTMQIVVNPLPTVTTGTYGPACENDANIALSGSPAGGTWSGTGVSGSVGSFVFDPSLGSQTLNYSYTDGNGCSNSASTIVTVNPLPTVTDATTSTVCEGSPATIHLTGLLFNTLGTATYTHPLLVGVQTASGTSNGVGEFDFTTPALPLIANNTIATLTGITNTATGCSQTFNKQVTLLVNAKVTPTFTQVAAICAGASLSALPTTSNNGIAGTWSPAVNNMATTTYTFTPTTGQCANTATMEIVVNPLPTVTDATTSAVCEGSPATIHLTGLLFNTLGTATYTHPLLVGVQTASGTSNGAGEFDFTTPALPLIANNTIATLTGITNTATGCSQTFNKQVTLLVNAKVTPTFTQVAAICAGASLSALPTTSNNGIAGTWSPAVNNMATTTYTFTPTTGQCANTATMEIVVNPLPTVTDATTSAVCEGSPATIHLTGLLFNTLGTATYTHPLLVGVQTASGTSNGAGEFDFTTPALPLIANNTIATLTGITNTATGCSQTFNKQVTLLVNAKVTPTFTQVAAICAGASLSALPTTSNNGIAGTWSPAVNNMATTTYTFTPTTGQCANTATMEIVVNPLPTVTDATTSAVCEGSPATIHLTGLLFNTLGTATYTHPLLVGVQTASGTSNGAGEFDFTTPALPLVANNTIATLTGITNTATGCSQTFNKQVTLLVNAKVTPTFTQVAAICAGASLSALPTTSNNGIAGTWSPAVNNMATTTYTFTPTTGQCANTATMEIVVNPLPTVTDATTSAVCEGSPATIHLTGLLFNTLGTATYTHPLLVGVQTASGTSNGAGEFDFTTPALPLIANNTIATLTGITNTATGCSQTFNKQVTLLVNAKVTPTFTQVAAICAGATLSALPTTSNNGITGTWSPAVNNMATTTYTFTPTTGQCANTATMEIVVNPLPTVTDATTSAVCEGSPATIHLTGLLFNTLGTATYTHPLLVGVQTASGTSNGAGEFDFTTPALPLVANNTIATLTGITNTATGCSQTFNKQVTLLVNAKVTPTFTQVAAICAGASLSALPTTSNNGIAGTWSPAVNNMATTTYTFTPTTGQCANTATMEIVVNQPVDPTFTQVPAICKGETLSALPTSSTNTPTAITGTWSPALNNMATTTYTFTPTAGQCANSATMEIVVNPPPTPTITNNSNTTILTCLQTSISLTATGGTSYSWNDGAMVLGTNDMLTISSAGTYTVTVTATNGCTASTSVVITYAPDTEKPQITCPVVSTIEGCSTDAITVLTYSETEVITSMAGFTTAGGSASDNCGIVKVSYIDTKSTTSCPIVVSRVWTVTDAANLTASCTQIIEIKDNTPPTITLPSPFFDTNPPTTIINDVAVFNTPSTSCDLNVVFNKPILSDNCSLKENIILSVSAKNSMGGSISIFNQVDTFSGNFPLGNNTLTITATDLCGKVSTKQLTIRIVDTIKPVKPTLPAITGCGAVASPTTIDNCSGVITGTTTNPTEYYVAGSYTITWLFTDESGNTETATQQVTVTGSGVIAGSVVKDITSADNLVNGALQTSVVAHVSLVKGSTIVATVPVTAGLYTLPDVCAGIYNVVLHTTATGSTSPQLPAGYSGFVGEGKLNGAPDVSPNGVAQVTISSGSLVYGNARVAAGGDVSFGLGPQALPVRLISFEGKPTDKGNLLTWSSSAEQNFSHYEVERSTDAKAFVNIGKVATTNGNSKETNSYQYLDAASGMLPGAVTSYTNDSYYRLKMVDLDGSSEYSKVIFIKTEKIGNSTVGQFYPNPTSSNETAVEINSATNSAWQITTLDLAGRVISTEYRNLEMGRNLVKLSTEKLSPGTNIIRFENNNGVQYRKLIKN